MISSSKYILILSAVVIVLFIFQSSSTIFVNASSGQDLQAGAGYHHNSTGSSDRWWTHWVGDRDNNGIEDCLDTVVSDSEACDGNMNEDILIDYAHHPGAAEVRDLERLGLEVTYVSKYINTVALGSVKRSVLNELRALDGVVMIERQAVYAPLLDVSTPAMKVSASSTYSNYAREFALTGDGVVIAVIDTGVDDDHDSLDGKFIAGADFSGGIISLKNPDDKDGHGTHVAGIALGDGGSTARYVGVAPDAGLVDVKVFNDWSPTTSSSTVMQGIEWCLDNADTYGIDILSISIGEIFVGNDDGQSSEAQLLNTAVDAGMVVVVAAGNEGPDNNGFSGFAAADKVITVGSIFDQNTIERKDDVISDYSNCGPRADDGDSDRLDELKPDVSAPGEDIMSAQYAASVFVSPGNYYVEKSGTSMAAPQVAGLSALLLEANSALTPTDVKTIICDSAEPKGKIYNSQLSDTYSKEYGFGIVDAYEAAKRASGEFQRAAITSLNSGDGIGGMVELRGTASNDRGMITTVELSFDDGRAWVAAHGTYIWNFTWDSSTVPNGDFTISLRTSNGTAYSEVFKYPVLILNVMAGFSYPYPDAKVKGTVRIEGTISTRDTISFVEIRIDDGPYLVANDLTGKGTWSTWYYEWPSKSVRNGWHTIHARTYVDGIYSKESSVRVKVDNSSDKNTPGFDTMTAVAAITVTIVILNHFRLKKVNNVNQAEKSKMHQKKVLIENENI